MTLSIDWAGVVLLRRVFSFVGVIVILSACSVSVRASDSLFDLLDLEGDGALGRYEAMAEWLKLVEEADLNDDGKVTRQELQKFQRVKNIEISSRSSTRTKIDDSPSKSCRKNFEERPVELIPIGTDSSLRSSSAQFTSPRVI